MKKVSLIAKTFPSVILFGFLTASLAASALAQQDSNGSVQRREGAQRVNVDAIKEKYWARGDETALGVVQNRLYSKAGKFNLGMLGGITTTDPFLSVKDLGLNLGYNFSEYFGAQVIYLRQFTTLSSAHDALEEGNGDDPTDGVTANTNFLKGYLGAEVNGSLMYGKLSLLGKKIIYYDLHLSGGLGVTETETGRYITPSLGIGQQFYLAQWMSLRVDYRLMVFQERIIEKEITSQLGDVRGVRNNFGHFVSVGVNILFSPEAIGNGVSGAFRWIGGLF